MPDNIAPQDKTSLAALIASRICHDLISPIGAISNGLELMGMAQAGPQSPEMALTQQSCDSATARIRFFRIAFGSAMDGRPVPVSEAETILKENFAGSRITPSWDIDTHLPRGTVQLGYLAILCLEVALPQGGYIVARDEEGAFHVTAKGPSVVEDTSLWSVLRQGVSAHVPDLRPAHVQFGLLAQLCEDVGFPITVSFSGDTAEIALSLSDQRR